MVATEIRLNSETLGDAQQLHRPRADRWKIELSAQFGAAFESVASPQAQVSHLHSNSSASRRTKPAPNAFAITFADRMPTTAN